MNQGTLNLGIIMDQGEDFQAVIQINDAGSPPMPIDITGYQFKGQMRATTDPTSPVVAEFEFTTLDQTTNKGQVLWELPNADTTTLETSVANAETPIRLDTPYLFDVKMMDTSEVVTRILQGIIKVSPQVTQETFT